MSLNKYPEAHQNETAHQAYWQYRARMVVFIINACWILTLGLNLLTFIALLYIVLVVCRFGANAFWITAVAFGAIGIVALIRKIRSGSLMSWRDGLVLLEDRLGLESGLSSAQDGAANWPQPRKIPRLFQPRMRWFLLPVLAWTAAWQIQVRPESYASASREMPSRGEKLKETIDKIKEQNLVDPKEVEKLVKSMEALSAQDPQKLFSHESMEAMDSFQERLDAAIDANEKALKSLEDTFSAMKNQPGEMDAGQRSELNHRMDKALDSLSSGALPLDPQLMKQLRDLSESTEMGGNGQQAMQALQRAHEGFESLDKQGKTGSQSQSRTPGESKKGDNQGTGNQNTNGPGSQKPGNGSTYGECEKNDEKSQGGTGGKNPSNNDKDGNSGISRGPGEAPLNLFEKPPSLTSQSETELESGKELDENSNEVTSITRRLPQVSAPESDKTDTDITTQSGTAAATWKDALTPDEEEILKQVLK